MQEKLVPRHPAYLASALQFQVVSQAAGQPSSPSGAWKIGIVNAYKYETINHDLVLVDSDPVDA